jgi:hypothetical protein
MGSRAEEDFALLIVPMHGDVLVVQVQFLHFERDAVSVLLIFDMSATETPLDLFKLLHHFRTRGAVFDGET